MDYYEDLGIYTYLVDVIRNGVVKIRKACRNETQAKVVYEEFKKKYYDTKTNDHIRIRIFDYDKNTDIEYVDNKADIC